MTLAMKGLCAVLLLTATVSAASAQPNWYSAQPNWYYFESGPPAAGYYGTPYGGGPQDSEGGGGDQFGYGPGYSYAKQAPPGYYRYYFGY